MPSTQRGMSSVVAMRNGAAGGARSEARPTASLSLDADNQWTYMKIHGDPGWESFPSYLDALVEQVLGELSAHGLRITWFVVGADADRPENADALGALVPAGHEVGNHSYWHEPWLHRYSEDDLDDELARAEDAIEGATGVRPDGFRGPGYSLSSPTLRVLVRRGYTFDASTLPTVIGPIARAYYFRTAHLTAEQRAERAHLFGDWRDGLRPIAPYRWLVDDRTLLEIPVTTVPGLRVPMHVSYLLMLSERSPAAARGYFDAVLRACRLTGIGPSVLLHPLDFLSADDAPPLGFFPGMAIPAEVKRERVSEYLDLLARHFRVVPVGEHAAELASRELPVRVPSFEAEAA